jgi:glutamate 5-kinase
MGKRIVVKVGTSVISDSYGVLDRPRMSAIVSQIVALKSQGNQVILVSSGAMGAGKALLRTNEYLSGISKKQVYSAVGQAHLIEQYSKLFRKSDIYCGQVLATKEDFRDRRHYFNMRNCFEALLSDAVVPIVNENDAIAVEELTFTDNDELAGLVASMLNADQLIILSSVDGLIDYTNGTSVLIPKVNPDDQHKYSLLVSPDKSEAGRGGMTTKYKIARKLANQGIEVVIVNGALPSTLVGTVAGDSIGTRFVPRKRVSSIKRRVAHSDLAIRGIVQINQGAEASVTDKQKANSLLLVGVVSLTGDFEKGDVIEIVSESNSHIGYGMTQYSAREADQLIGEHGIRPLIHFDQMFIEQ